MIDKYSPAPSTVAFSKKLLGIFPELENTPGFDKSNWDVPYLFITDFRKYVISVFRKVKQEVRTRGHASHEDRLKQVFQIFEDNVNSSDDAVRNLIRAGFLETFDLDVSDQEYDELKAMLGPKTRAALVLACEEDSK